MTFPRKLEIVCGAATAVLGIAAAAQMLSTDLETMRRLEREFPVGQELLGASIFFVLPALLVAIGAYIHGSRVRSWGLPMVMIGAVSLVFFFSLLTVAPAYSGGPVRLHWLNLSLAAMAIVTVLVSLSVHFVLKVRVVHQSNVKG